MNKKLAAAVIAVSLVAAACNKIQPTPLPVEGTLSLAGLTLQCDESLISRAASSAPGSYRLFVRDASGKEVYKGSWSSVSSGDESISLAAGDYTLEARSTEEEVPASAFGKPVYGATTEFSITAGETTSVGSLTCTLLQAKATVSYDSEFLATVTGDGRAVVSVDPSAPLEYALSYNGGSPSFSSEEGYFAVNNGENTTMNIVFTGSIEGKNQKMVANLVNIAPRQWCHIKFIRKVDSQGTATFGISIIDYVSDSELVVDLEAEQLPVVGEDPRAGKGDGDIRITLAPDCTMFSDLSDIRVPGMQTPMDLRLKVSVPGGVSRMIVDMASTSSAFIDAVALAGGTRLDLLNPAPEQDIVFQIVPFPHGSDLAGKTELEFDLSGAQEPILAFPGVHTFTMKISDMNGCTNSIPVILVVE